MYAKVTLNLDTEELLELKKKLLEEGGKINTSELFRKWITAYLKKGEQEPNSKIPELKQIIETTETKFSLHDYGPNGTGICFKCTPPHRKPNA